MNEYPSEENIILIKFHKNPYKFFFNCLKFWIIRKLDSNSQPFKQKCKAFNIQVNTRNYIKQNLFFQSRTAPLGKMVIDVLIQASLFC